MSKRLTFWADVKRGAFVAGCVGFLGPLAHARHRRRTVGDAVPPDGDHQEAQPDLTGWVMKRKRQRGLQRGTARTRAQNSVLLAADTRSAPGCLPPSLWTSLQRGPSAGCR